MNECIIHVDRFSICQKNFKIKCTSCDKDIENVDCKYLDTKIYIEENLKEKT